MFCTLSFHLFLFYKLGARLINYKTFLWLNKFLNKIVILLDTSNYRFRHKRNSHLLSFNVKSTERLCTAKWRVPRVVLGYSLVCNYFQRSVSSLHNRPSLFVTNFPFNKIPLFSNVGILRFLFMPKRMSNHFQTNTTQRISHFIFFCFQDRQIRHFFCFIFSGKSQTRFVLYAFLCAFFYFTN